ncbi:MAG: hypothetical protein EXR98_11080 [Gemmataceae bacterium]|nr:hypothetical protein [Gemmataceae bacterium]
MAIRITCPACKTSQSVNEDKRGRKVRCSECDKSINVPESKRDDDEAVQDRPRIKTKSTGRKDDDDDDRDSDRPSLKKRAAAKSGFPILIVAGVAIVLLPLCAGVLGLGGWFFLGHSPKPPDLLVEADGKKKDDELPPWIQFDDRKDKKNSKLDPPPRTEGPERRQGPARQDSARHRAGGQAGNGSPESNDGERPDRRGERLLRAGVGHRRHQRSRARHDDVDLPAPA